MKSGSFTLWRDGYAADRVKDAVAAGTVFESCRMEWIFVHGLRCAFLLKGKGSLHERQSRDLCIFDLLA